jgi:hypothetical protein
MGAETPRAVIRPSAASWSAIAAACSIVFWMGHGSCSYGCQTSLEGTWTLSVLRDSDGVILRVGRIADREVDEGYGLGLEYDEGWRVTYSTDAFSPEAVRLMSRCGSSGSPAASPG